MAYYGLSKPWVGKYSVNAETNEESYATPIQAGEAVSTEVTPNYQESKLFGDNKTVEVVKEFVDASLTMGITRIPVQMAEMMFGHSVTEEGEETSNANDAAPYVGYGFIVREMIGGVSSYRACFLPKVQMVEGTESYQTKGDSITFSTPSLSGSAMANVDGDWRIKSQPFATETEANAWIKSKFGAS